MNCNQEASRVYGEIVISKSMRSAACIRDGRLTDSKKLPVLSLSHVRATSWLELAIPELLLLPAE
jgi:hypothetical protein